MKKINKNDIKKATKLLKDLQLKEYSSKCQIFFPIETGRQEDFDGLELNVKHTGIASKKVQTPGLTIKLVEIDGGKSERVVFLVYADIDYSPAFDILEHVELTGGKISNDLRTFLSETECYLVNKDYITGFYWI